MPKLDRFLILDYLESYICLDVQVTLPRPVFDHCLLLLDRGGIRRGPIPFRFENMWLRMKGFRESLMGWW